MKHLKRPLLTILLAAGASFTCFAQTAQPTPTQEYHQKVNSLIGKANEMIQNDPREALAAFEAQIQIEAPAFDTESPAGMVASSQLYTSLARFYFESARAADSAGHWEKAAEYHRRSVQVILEATTKTKESSAKFSEGFEHLATQIQGIMDANADEINKLKTKEEKDYTNDDWLSKEKLLKWETDLKELQDAIGYYKNLVQNVENQAVYYRTTSGEDRMLEKIRGTQNEIDNYRGGPGDKAKWVEGVVANHNAYMSNYHSQEDRIAMTYRLIVLSPESTTAPVLLNVLQGKATEADLKRAIQRRPPARGTTRGR